MWPQKIEPFYDSEKYDSKNWTSSHFLDLTQRIEFFLWLQAFWRKNESKNWTFFSVGLKELNFFSMFFLIRHTELNHVFSEYDTELNHFFLNTTHRIEPFFSWVWFKELNIFFLNVTQRIDFFSNMTQRIEFFLYDSKNWTFFWTWLIELNHLFNMTQRIEPFFLSVT